VAALRRAGVDWTVEVIGASLPSGAA